MKKIYKIIAILIAISNNFLQKVSASLSFGSDSYRGLTGGAPSSNAITMSFGFEMFLKLFIIPFLLILLILNIIILPYRFYKSYKIKSIEEKNKIFLPLIIEKYIFNIVICIILLFWLIDLLDHYLSYHDTLNNIIIIIIINYIIQFLFGIYIYKKKDKIYGKKVIINTNLFSFSIYFLVSILLMLTGILGI